MFVGGTMFLDYHWFHGLSILRYVVGKKQIIEIDEIVMERLIELIDSNIEQSKLMFLTGKNKSYEHSWKHFINKIDYFKSSHNHKGEEK